MSSVMRRLHGLQEVIQTDGLLSDQHADGIFILQWTVFKQLNSYFKQKVISA